MVGFGVLRSGFDDFGQQADGLLQLPFLVVRHRAGECLLHRNLLLFRHKTASSGSAQIGLKTTFLCADEPVVEYSFAAVHPLVRPHIPKYQYDMLCVLSAILRNL